MAITVPTAPRAGLGQTQLREVGAPTASAESFGARDAQSVTRVGAVGLGASNVLDQATTRIRSREDAIARSRDGSAFFETAADNFRRRSTEGNGFATADDVKAYRQELDAEMQKALANHRGSDESKARLAERLGSIRSTLLDDASRAAVSNQRAAINADLTQRTNTVASTVLDDPSSLPQAYATLDAIIDDVADALTPEEEIENRAVYRAQVTGAAIEGMLARGAYDEARELLSVPGVAESLPPQMQTSIASRLTLVQRQEEEARNERRRRLEDAAFALGTTVDQLPLWARAQAVGLQIPTGPARESAQSPQGKIIEDRQRFVEQFGPDSPQVAAFDQLTATQESPASLSDAAGIRKEFTQLSKDFVQVRDAFNRVEASASNASPAGDLALIFNYMKILDPGSAVREGEFATAQNAQGVPGRIRSLYNQIVSGERLNADTRADFVSRAEELFAAQMSTQMQLERQFQGIAERAGAIRDDVIVDFIGPLRNRLGGDDEPVAGATAPGAPQAGVIEYDLSGRRIGQSNAPAQTEPTLQAPQPEQGPTRPGQSLADAEEAARAGN